MAVVFPFEADFYRRHGVNVTFVGHPLLETVHATEGRDAVFAKIGLDSAKPAIALLPGSRRREVEYHLPVMRDAAIQFNRKREVQFYCVRASTIDPSIIESGLRNPIIRIPVVESERYDAVHAADLVWTASGTATLETALLARPMIVMYRLSWLTYGIARLLVRVEHVGMVNLIAGERLVPELIQSEVNAARLVAESETLLDDRVLRSAIIGKLAKLRERLGTPGAADRVADLAYAMMAQS
jgi:lipid-A-disaccharide synthase